MPFIDDLQTLRERAGLTRAELARLAEVDRATIAKLEKHHPSRADICNKLINALNERYYGKNSSVLSSDVVITQNSRFS
jgi:DNA-binding XRE family transcriptional regulator